MTFDQICGLYGDYFDYSDPDDAYRAIEYLVAQSNRNDSKEPINAGDQNKMDEIILGFSEPENVGLLDQISVAYAQFRVSHANIRTELLVNSFGYAIAELFATEKPIDLTAHFLKSMKTYAHRRKGGMPS